MALTPHQSMHVAYYCTAETAGFERPLKPAEPLTAYGIFTPEQCFILKHKIVGPSPNSVKRFGHSLHPKHLLMLSPGWTMAQLAGVIEANAVAGVPVDFVANDSLADDEKIALAHVKVAGALSLLASMVPPNQPTGLGESKDHLAMTKSALKKSISADGKLNGRGKSE